MWEFNVSDDQRRARRFTLAEDQQAAELRSDDWVVRARVINESATGFLVETDQSPPARRGDMLKLHTLSGWFEVRVVHASTDHRCARFGVERVADLIDRNEIPRTHLPGLRALGHFCLQANQRLSMLTLMALGAMVPLLFLGVLAYSTNHHDPHASTGGLQKVAWPPPPAHGAPRYATPSADLATDTARGRQALLASRVELLKNLASSSDLAASLQLNGQQRQEIGRIVQTCLQPPSPRATSQLSRAETVEKAYADVLDLLTDDQKKRLLVGSSHEG